LQAIPTVTEEEKVWPQPVFGTKSATFSGRVRAWIVCMNNEVSLASLWAEPDEFREDIVTIVFGIKTPALWTNLDQVKSQWIPCNCHHHFCVLNRVFPPFRGFLIDSKPDLVMISGKIEPRHVEGDNSVPTLMFD
jgi:hypothetical protein